MKKSKNYLLITVGLIATASMSWKILTSPPVNIVQQKFYSADYGLSNVNNADVDDLYSTYFYQQQKNITPPPAEDVLVQRIPGDNQHIKIMAVYSYKRFHADHLNIQFTGRDLTMRDDGNGFDDVAGDGVYTAVIPVDVQSFRKEALDMLALQKKNATFQPLFTDREMNAFTSCLANPLSAEKFDAGTAVSISNLDNQSASSSNKVETNCIFLTDLSVVEDPTRTWNPCTQTGNVDGAWTFKTIMKNLASESPTNLASDAKVSDFVKTFFNSWSAQKIINGDTVEARMGVKTQILDPWVQKSAAAGAPSGQLDMRFAPFKLTAIVNRFDLRERASGIPAGEARLIFCLINPDCTAAEDFNIIFEYGIPVQNEDCSTLQNWALQWFDLKNFTLGSPDYNAALQAITDQFTICGTNPNRINQSCIDAVRTGERALVTTTPFVWEFREFHINGTTHKLNQTTVAQVPADRYNKQAESPDVIRMVKFINENASGIVADAYTVPTTYDSFPFLGGKAQILDTPVGLPSQPYHWDGVEDHKSAAFIDGTAVRHIFSRNTCSGCHAGEVQTFFTHVDPVFFGTEATLSGFLTGKAGRGGAVDADNNPDNTNFMVFDAAARGGKTQNGKIRKFHDIIRRAADLRQVASTACTSPFALRNTLMFQPVGSVH